MDFTKPRGYKNTCASETVTIKEEKMNSTWTGYIGSIGSIITAPITKIFSSLTVKDDNC